MEFIFIDNNCKVWGYVVDKSYISKEQLILLELTGFDWSDILKKYLIDNETIDYYKDDMDWSISLSKMSCRNYRKV